MVAVLTRYSDLVMIQYCQYFHCVGFAVKFQEAGNGFGARCKHTILYQHGGAAVSVSVSTCVL